MKKITAILLILSLFLLQIPVFAEETAQVQEKEIPEELTKAVTLFDYIEVIEKDFNIQPLHFFKFIYFVLFMNKILYF